MLFPAHCPWRCGKGLLPKQYIPVRGREAGGGGECKWHCRALTHPFTDFIHFCVCSQLDSCVGHVKSEKFFVPKTGRWGGEKQIKQWMRVCGAIIAAWLQLLWPANSHRISHQSSKDKTELAGPNMKWDGPGNCGSGPGKFSPCVAGRWGANAYN